MEEKISNEAAIIGRTKAPMTGKRLRRDFEALGIEPGMCLMVHSSLSSIGWIPGGAQLVIETLLDVLGGDGTLMVPTHSTYLTDPATWAAPPVPKEWHEEIRNGFPAFDPRKSQTRGMGILPETLRRWPGAIRSNHPHTSFCAVGNRAEELMADHALASPMGTGSPLQKLCDIDGTTLLLGVGYGNNTCFHLAEDSLDNPPRVIDGAPILQDGKSAWVKFDSIDYDDEGFDACGAAFEKTGKSHKGKVGNADCYMFPTRIAVDFAKTWLRQNR